MKSSVIPYPPLSFALSSSFVPSLHSLVHTRLNHVRLPARRLKKEYLSYATSQLQNQHLSKLIIVNKDRERSLLLNPELPPSFSLSFFSSPLFRCPLSLFSSHSLSSLLSSSFFAYLMLKSNLSILIHETVV